MSDWLSMDNTVERFYFLDLDRTLLNTSSFFNSFKYFISKHPELGSEALDHLERRDDELRVSGGSLDVITELSDMFSKEVVSKLLYEFISKSQSEPDRYFNEGASELIRSIKESRSAKFGILTTGGQEWQKTKLTILGLDGVPHMIINRHDKAALISEWERSSEGYIILPKEFGKIVVKELVLVDDKTRAFIGLPEGVIGYLYRPKGVQERVSQKGKMPDNIEVVQSLNDIRLDKLMV